MIRVFVIAPTPMMQAGLQSMLTTGSIHVVGMAAAPEEVALLPEIDVIVIADDGQLEEIGRSFPNTQSPALVVLTNDDERALMQMRALAVPGWGIVTLDAPAAQLQAAVAACAQGLIALPTHLSNKLNALRAPRVEAMKLDTPDEPLTPREREVLELVGQGLSNKLIARALHISEHTVKFHIASFSTKLGAISRTDAVRLGVRSGLITL